MKKLIIIVFIIFCGSSFAQELVFNFINPSFIGGNPYNASWLLSSAQAQNTITESVKESDYSNESLDDFESSLKRQILNQLTRQLMSDAFGENALKEGRYEIGDFLIDIAPNDNGVSVQIFDTSTGGETTVIVPYY